MLVLVSSDNMGAGDSLIVRGMRFYGRHGVLKEEKILGQRFNVDVDVGSDLSVAGRTDQLSDTLNYVRVFQVAKEIVEGPPCNLVEKVAQNIADGVLRELPQAQHVRVRIMKPHVALPGVLDGIGVEIVRDRN